jgi:hypothetical protein
MLGQIANDTIIKHLKAVEELRTTLPTHAQVEKLINELRCILGSAEACGANWNLIEELDNTIILLENDPPVTVEDLDDIPF